MHTVSPLLLFTKRCKSNLKNQIKNQELLEACWYFPEFSPGFFNINWVIERGWLFIVGQWQGSPLNRFHFLDGIFLSISIFLYYYDIVKGPCQSRHWSYSSTLPRHLAIHKVFGCCGAKTHQISGSWRQGIRILYESPSTGTNTPAQTGQWYPEGFHAKSMVLLGLNLTFLTCSFLAYPQLTYAKYVVSHDLGFVWFRGAAWVVVA